MSEGHICAPKRLSDVIRDRHLVVLFSAGCRSEPNERRYDQAEHEGHQCLEEIAYGGSQTDRLGHAGFWYGRIDEAQGRWIGEAHRKPQHDADAGQRGNRIKQRQQGKGRRADDQRADEHRPGRDPAQDHPCAQSREGVTRREGSKHKPGLRRGDSDLHRMQGEDYRIDR